MCNAHIDSLADVEGKLMTNSNSDTSDVTIVCGVAGSDGGSITGAPHECDHRFVLCLLEGCIGWWECACVRYAVSRRR